MSKPVLEAVPSWGVVLNELHASLADELTDHDTRLQWLLDELVATQERVAKWVRVVDKMGKLNHKLDKRVAALEALVDNLCTHTDWLPVEPEPYPQEDE